MEDLKKFSFLIVDDMSTMRKIVKKLLRDLGADKFVEAVDGKDALKKIVENKGGPNEISFIISDWSMPNATGLDLLKTIRGSENFKEMPFVMVTAEQDVAQIQEAIASDVDGYVIKPFDQISFKKRLSLAMKKRFPAG